MIRYRKPNPAELPPGTTIDTETGEPMRLLTKLSDVILSPDDPRLRKVTINGLPTVMNDGVVTVPRSLVDEALLHHRANLGDTIMTPGGGSITLTNKAEALAYHRNPAKFLDANSDRIVPPPKILPEPKVQLRRARAIKAIEKALPGKLDDRKGIVVPKRGRTPDKDRTAKSKAALLEAGGERFTGNLRPDAAKALAELQRRLGLNKTETVEHALCATLAATPRRRAG